MFVMMRMFFMMHSANHHPEDKHDWLSVMRETSRVRRAFTQFPSASNRPMAERDAAIPGRCVPWGRTLS